MALLIVALMSLHVSLQMSARHAQRQTQTAYIVMAYVVMAYVVMACKVMAYVVVAYVVMAYIVMTYVVMAYIVMANIVMAYVVVAYVVMAYIVMTYVVMAYIVMAYIVMAQWQAQTAELQQAIDTLGGKLAQQEARLHSCLRAQTHSYTLAKVPAGRGMPILRSNPTCVKYIV